MTFLEILQAYQQEGKSVRRMLSSFGITKWSNFLDLLKTLSEEEVVAILFNWITRNLTRDEIIKLRIHDEHTQDAYEMTLQNKRGCLYVIALQHCAHLKGQMLYYWPMLATHNNITAKTIQKSMEVANQIIASKKEERLQ